MNGKEESYSHKILECHDIYPTNRRKYLVPMKSLRLTLFGLVRNEVGKSETSWLGVIICKITSTSWPGIAFPTSVLLAGSFKK